MWEGSRVRGCETGWGGNKDKRQDMGWVGGGNIKEELLIQLPSFPFVLLKCLDYIYNNLTSPTRRPVLPCNAWGFGSPPGRYSGRTEVSKQSGAGLLLCSH